MLHSIVMIIFKFHNSLINFLSNYLKVLLYHIKEILYHIFLFFLIFLNISYIFNENQLKSENPKKKIHIKQ